MPLPSETAGRLSASPPLSQTPSFPHPAASGGVKLIVVLPLCLFAFLAFYQLNEQGLLYHDAGVYLLEAKFLDEGFRTLLNWNSSDPKSPSFWEDMRASTSGVPLHSGKPGFNFILWLASLVRGWDDSLSAEVTALAAVVSLVLTFLIARKLSNVHSAVYSTAVLASSVFYLVYARSGLAEQAVTVFFLLGLLLYLHSRNRPFSLASTYGVGLCLGYAFTCNPWRVGYMPVLLIFLDVAQAVGRDRVDWMVAVRRVLLLVLGYLTTIVAFEVPYLGAKGLVGGLPFSDYWTQLGQKFKILGDVAWFHYQSFGELAEDFWIVEGPFFPLAVAAGWLFLTVRWMRQRRFEDLFLLTFSLAPFFYFSSMGTAGGGAFPRVTSNFIPIAAICVGETFWAAEQRIPSNVNFFKKLRVVAVWILTLFVLAQAFPRQLETGITRSGYREVSQYLKSTEEEKFMILAMEPVWRFYLERQVQEPDPLPSSMKELVEKAQSEDIHYLLLDYAAIHSKYGGGFVASLLGRSEPAATFLNPVGTALPYLLDQFGLKVARRNLETQRGRQIYIYRIEEVAQSLHS